MGPFRVDARDEKTHTIGSPAIFLRVALGAIADALGDFRERDGARVSQPAGEGLLLHEVGEDAGVGSKAGESDAIVAVYFDDLLLVRGELFCVALPVVLVSYVAS
jgi:hypothetical protein